MSAPTKPKRRLRSFLYVMLALITVTALGLWGIYLAGSSAISTQVDAIRAAGEPLTFDELFARRPEIPDEFNSAHIVESALEDLKSLLGLDRELQLYVGLSNWFPFPDVGEPYSADQIAVIRAFVADQADLVGHFNPFAEGAHGAFERRPLAGMMDDSFMHGVAGVRIAVRLLRARSTAACLDGQVNAAIRDVIAMLNLNALLEYDAWLSNTLAYASNDVLAVEQLEHCLTFGDAPAPLLVQVADQMQHHEASDALCWGMWGDRAFQWDVYQAYRRGDLIYLSLDDKSDRIVIQPLADAWGVVNQAKGMSILNKLVELSKSPECSDRAVSQIEQECLNLSLLYAITRILTPTYVGTFEEWNRRTAMLRCARTGIAAERYRMATGDWPETLEDLVPIYIDAVPANPYDGKPLRYEIDDDMITIYGTVAGKNVGKTRGRLPDAGFRLLDPDRRGLKIEEDESEAPSTE